MEAQALEIIDSGFSTRPYVPQKKKLVVFDLDETIGDFYMFYYFWRFLIMQYEYSPESLKTADFIHQQTTINQILDLYPEFFRPGISVIFQYLIHKKRTGHLSIMWLYTNNTLSPQYPVLIKNYIHHFIRSDLIDNIVSAFSIKGRRVDLRRFEVEKEYADFINCLNYGEDLDICFVDNHLHEGMIHCQVFYIKLNTYRHGLSFAEIMKRLYYSPLGDILFHRISYMNALGLLNDFLEKEQVVGNQGMVDVHTEYAISLQLLGQIKHFFKTNGRFVQPTLNHTRKRRPKAKNKNELDINEMNTNETNVNEMKKKEINRKEINKNTFVTRKSIVSE
jgi:hypothetical protein